MKSFRPLALATALLASGAGFALAQNQMVGGAEMFAERNIVENAVNSADHTTLVAAVKAADLVETLSGEGPFTVFAPTNEAFEALPEGTVDTLLLPENKDQLTNVLTYHVVPGRITAEDLMAKIAENDGAYIFEAVNGTKLSAQTRDGVLFIGDLGGNNAQVTVGDVMQSNGVIHVIDKVLLPM
jgi:uncharacterized surface protein with fasciclin (FAS1) repeats